MIPLTAIEMRRRVQIRVSLFLLFRSGTTKLGHGELTNALSIFGEFRTKRTVRMRGSVADWSFVLGLVDGFCCC